jgi:hypothetical protein
VHALGEARFEIVDKGSSNGVRVNGADLRRGIIEAGDIIELGDVKFKFVGEGQLFRPGTTDSQQLAAIGHRAATSVIKTKSSHGVVLPAVVVAVLLAIAVGAAIVLRSPPPRGESPVPTASASSGAPDTTGIDAAMLAEARRMCDVGEVEAAHQKASQLVAESPLHTSDDFKYVEAKWSELALMQADSERDPATKYAIYQRLTSDPFLDPTVKKFALAHMNAIDTTPQRDASKTAVAAAPQAVRTAEPAVPTAAPVRPTPQAAPEAPAPRPAPRPAPASLSLSDLATSSNPADWQKARDQLEPKVFGKRGATADDVRMLKAICKAQHDQTCLTELSHM